MPKKSKPTEYYNWKKRSRQNPGEALPKLPVPRHKGEFFNEKSFATYFGLTKNVKRSYLNARAQYAGYSSFESWEKAREITGTKKKTPARKKEKNFKGGRVGIWAFQESNGEFPDSLRESNIKSMDKFVKAVPAGMIFQFFAQVKNYSSDDSTKPKDWGFWSTPFFSRSEVLENVLSMFNTIFEFVEADSSSRAYTYKDKRGNTHVVPGIREIHIAYFKEMKKK